MIQRDKKRYTYTVDYQDTDKWGQITFHMDNSLRKYIAPTSIKDFFRLAYFDTMMTKIRYAKWLEYNNLQIERKWCGLCTLDKKRDCMLFEDRKMFDHTDFFKRPDEDVSICLTQPYIHAFKEEDCADKIEYLKNKYTLDCKIYAPSQKSLWYPDRTYMIFWWSKKYGAFDPKWMDHKDAKDIEKECKIT